RSTPEDRRQQVSSLNSIQSYLRPKHHGPLDGKGQPGYARPSYGHRLYTFVKTLSTPTRQDAVLARLREALIAGEIAPGAHLVQDDLASRYGVSRIPLREALRTLESEGLVTIEPNRGAVCRPLEPKDLVDLYDLRICL